MPLPPDHPVLAVISPPRLATGATGATEDPLVDGQPTQLVTQLSALVGAPIE